MNKASELKTLARNLLEGKGFKSISDALKFVSAEIEKGVKGIPGVDWDRDNHHDSEIYTIWVEDSAQEPKIEALAKDIVKRASHSGVVDEGWRKEEGGDGVMRRYYVIDVDGLQFGDEDEEDEDDGETDD